MELLTILIPTIVKSVIISQTGASGLGASMIEDSIEYASGKGFEKIEKLQKNLAKEIKVDLKKLEENKRIGRRINLEKFQEDLAALLSDVNKNGGIPVEVSIVSDNLATYLLEQFKKQSKELGINPVSELHDYNDCLRSICPTLVKYYREKPDYMYEILNCALSTVKNVENGVDSLSKDLNTVSAQLSTLVSIITVYNNSELTNDEKMILECYKKWQLVRSRRIDEETYPEDIDCALIDSNELNKAYEARENMMQFLDARLEDSSIWKLCSQLPIAKDELRRVITGEDPVIAFSEVMCVCSEEMDVLPLLYIQALYDMGYALVLKGLKEEDSVARYVDFSTAARYFEQVISMATKIKENCMDGMSGITQAIKRKSDSYQRKASTYLAYDELKKGISDIPALRTNQPLDEYPIYQPIYSSAFDSAKIGIPNNKQNVERNFLEFLASGKTILMPGAQIFDNIHVLELLSDPHYEDLFRSGLITFSPYYKNNTPREYLINILKNRNFIFTCFPMLNSNVAESATNREIILKAVQGEKSEKEMISELQMEEIQKEDIRRLLQVSHKLEELFRQEEIDKYHQVDGKYTLKNFKRAYSYTSMNSQYTISKIMDARLDELYTDNYHIYGGMDNPRGRLLERMRKIKQWLDECRAEENGMTVALHTRSQYVDALNLLATGKAEIPDLELLAEDLDKFRHILDRAYNIYTGYLLCNNLYIPESDPDLRIQSEPLTMAENNLLVDYYYNRCITNANPHCTTMERNNIKEIALISREIIADKSISQYKRCDRYWEYLRLKCENGKDGVTINVTDANYKATDDNGNIITQNATTDPHKIHGGYTESMEVTCASPL